MDRYTRDEMLDHAQDFDDLAPNRGENERASATAALPDVPQAVLSSPFATPGAEARFLRHVELHPNGCWMWTGTRKPKGYGQFSMGHRPRAAHRLAHEAYIGPIPAGYEVDHLCGEPSCVNPAHLEAVTQRENWLRSNAITRIYAQSTHCIHGHEFTPENTKIDKKGHRECREVCAAAERQRHQEAA